MGKNILIAVLLVLLLTYLVQTRDANAGLFSPTDTLELNREALQEAVNNISYAKDRNGICYAFIGNLGWQTRHNVTFTTIPCEKVGL